MAKVTLKQIGDLRRPENISKNIYNESNQYDLSHPNALSDGDAKGRGENNGVIGTSIDIARRAANINKNRFNSANPYKVID